MHQNNDLNHNTEAGTQEHTAVPSEPNSVQMYTHFMKNMVLVPVTTTNMQQIIRRFTKVKGQQIKWN